MALNDCVQRTIVEPNAARTVQTGMRGLRRKYLLLATAIGFAAVSPFAVRAQSSTVPAAKSATVPGPGGAPLTFAVASVRRNITGTGSCDPEHFFVTPDGFHMANCPLDAVLFFAEVPSDGTTLGFSTQGRTVGTPEWMSSEKY